MEKGHRLIFDVESRCGSDEKVGELEITRREDGGALNTVAVENPPGLDRMEPGACIAQGMAGSVVDQALACLLGLLGLRISEALNIDIDHLGIERGHRTVTVLGKAPSSRWFTRPRSRHGPWQHVHAGCGGTASPELVGPTNDEGASS